MTGNDLPYMTSATIEASAKKASTPVVRIAAGAVPARTASSSTAVVVDDSFAEGDGENAPRRAHARKRMVPINDLAGVEIVAAPERERVARDERFSVRLAGDDGAAGNHAMCHSDSSRTTRPSTADRTQSARLPNVTRVFSRLGA